VLHLGQADGEGGVADGPVPRAAAQVAGQGVEVEAVGAHLVAVRLAVRGPGTLRAVVLRRHRADEPGGAVPALGAAAGGHLALDRVEVALPARARRPAQALRGDDLLALVGERGWQARVDRGPPGALLAVGTGDEHGAGTALPLRVPLLSAIQAMQS